MNIFELAFFLGILALIGLASKALGHLFGITPWVFPIPIIALVVLAIRFAGSRVRPRRLRGARFENGPNRSRSKNQNDKEVEK